MGALRRMAWVGMALVVGLSTAEAAKSKPPRPLRGRTAKIRESLADGALARARGALALAEERAPEQPRIVRPEGVAALWFLQGALALKAGEGTDAAGVGFRRALAVDPGLAWDPELLGSGDEWRFFEALRSEVGSKSPVDLGLPARHGGLEAYLDGRPVAVDSTALPGLHLAQVRCPDGTITGAWVELPKTPRWLKMCPGKLDLDAAPAENTAPAGDDDFGALDVFGDESPEGADESPAAPDETPAP